MKHLTSGQPDSIKLQPIHAEGPNWQNMVKDSQQFEDEMKTKCCRYFSLEKMRLVRGI